MTANYFLKRWNEYTSTQEKLRWLKQSIKRFYFNKALVEFMDKLIKLVPDQSQKISILLFSKKIIQQHSRIPEGEYLSVFKDQVDYDEQEIHNPVVWIDFELEYQQQILLQAKDTPVVYPNRIYQGENEIMKLEEILKTFDISKSTLDRWRVDGMPILKKGRKLFGHKKELVDWIESNKKKN